MTVAHKWIAAGVAAATGIVGLVIAKSVHGRPNALQERIAKALASKDRAAVKAIAEELRKKGSAEAAASLDAEISLLPDGHGVGIPMGVPPEDPRRQLAQKLTDHLHDHPRGKEDRELVLSFQTAERLNRDSRYGPGTATRILQRYGVVPVAPYYFSKGKQGELQKRLFVDFVKSYATGDPQRAAQYERLLKDTERS